MYNHDIVSQMFELYTTDVPASPDPEFISANLTTEIPFEELLLAKLNGSDDNGLRLVLEEWIESKKPGLPKEAFDDSRYHFEEFGAQGFINSFAVYNTDGKLNLDATSAKIGIPYTFEVRSSFVMGEIVGLKNSMPDEALEIHLTKNYHRQHLQTTFGHEIGHYFWQNILQKGLEGEGRNALEEKFCDYFGRRMAMPEQELRDFGLVTRETIIGMMSTFGVDLNDLIPQLISYGMLPKRVAVDTYGERVFNPDYSQKVMRTIYCSHCEVVGGDYNCPDAGQKAPLFDFTDRAWGQILDNGCYGEDLRKPDILSTLTKFYLSKEAQLVLFRPGAMFELGLDVEDPS